MEENSDSSNLTHTRTNDLKEGARIVSDRPDSLSLESVLEYTNKIKAFLGLEEEKVESNLDDRVSDYPRSFSVDEENDSLKMSSPDYNPESHFGLEMSTGDESRNPETLLRDKRRQIEVSLLPDIVGTPFEQTREVSHDHFPDILETSQTQKPGNNLATDEDILEQKKVDTLNMEKIDESIGRPTLLEESPYIQRKERIPGSEIDIENNNNNPEVKKEAAGKECENREDHVNGIKVPDVEMLIDPNATRFNDIQNATGDSVYQKENDNEAFSDENVCGTSSPEECHQKEQHRADNKEKTTKKNLKSDKNKDENHKPESDNGEDSDEEKPYQITHIEEGLREVEKSSNALKKIADQNPKVKNKKENDTYEHEGRRGLPGSSKMRKEHMDKIRKLSAEVVDSVLQSAGQQVKGILRRQKAIEETRKFSTSQNSGQLENGILEINGAKETAQNEIVTEEPKPSTSRKNSESNLDHKQSVSAENVDSVLKTAEGQSSTIAFNQNSVDDTNKPSTSTDIEQTEMEFSDNHEKDFELNIKIESGEVESNKPSEQRESSDFSMNQIRRLSIEFTNTVLQTAEDEVRLILRERNSIKKSSRPTTATDLEMSSIKEGQGDSKEAKQLSIVESDDSLKETGLLNVPTDACQNLPSIPEKCPSKSEEKNSFQSTASNKSIEILNAFVEDDVVLKPGDADTQCGFGPFRPQCLQPYATAKTYLILYSIIGILHGSYYTYLVGVLTTLEKRFEFKSKTSGVIMILDELTPLFLGVLVGHFGGRAHRPRMLSFGMFLSAFCCFASALPYFLYGTATHLTSLSVQNKTGIEMCDGDVRTSHCGTDDRPPTLTAILLLMLGSFLKGFGNIAYYAIGLAYLDDNSKKKNTPLYFAVALALRLLGPMVGFLMSSAFLKYYENPFETPDFGPDDPRWIGGWWMGFMLQGFLLLIFAGPIAFFPRRLPSQKGTYQAKTSSSTKMFDGLSASLKRLITNPLYVLLGLNAIFSIYGNFGFYIMLPKYMENQFRLSASSASLFAGPPGIAALMVSTVIGGYLIWKFKPTARFLAGGLVFVEVVSTVGYLLLMIPQCEKTQMTHFGYGKDSLILEDTCNLNCNCSTVSFTPVCGPDGKTSFFSPCYAGCSFQSDKKFSNCSCIDGYSDGATVTKGLCSSDSCWSQALAYIVTLPILQFVVNMLRVAYTMILLRSIKAEDKNIALGVFEAVLSTVAFIPFPILYGSLVDSACLVWEKSCGETGNCWFYDIQKFNHLMHGASAFFCGLSTLNLIAIFFLVNRIKDLYKDEEDISIQEISHVIEVEKDKVAASIKL